MWPDQVSNLGPPALQSDALLTALCGLAFKLYILVINFTYMYNNLCDRVLLKRDHDKKNIMLFL